MRSCHCQQKQTLLLSVCFVITIENKSFFCDFWEAEVTAGPFLQLLWTQVQRLLRNRSKHGEDDCWEQIVPESLCDVERIENFRMSHDVSVPRVSLSHKCKHTDQAAFTPDWLCPAGNWSQIVSSISSKRCQSQQICWPCSFSSAQTATLQQTQRSRRPIQSPSISSPAGGWASSMTDSFCSQLSKHYGGVSQVLTWWSTDLNRQSSRRFTPRIN